MPGSNRAVQEAWVYAIDERHTPALVADIDALLKRGKVKGDRNAALVDIPAVAAYKHVPLAMAGVAPRTKAS